MGKDRNKPLFIRIAKRDHFDDPDVSTKNSYFCFRFANSTCSLFVRMTCSLTQKPILVRVRSAMMTIWKSSFKETQISIGLKDATKMNWLVNLNTWLVKLTLRSKDPMQERRMGQWADSPNYQKHWMKWTNSNKRLSMKRLTNLTKKFNFLMTRQKLSVKREK